MKKLSLLTLSLLISTTANAEFYIDFLAGSAKSNIAHKLVGNVTVTSTVGERNNDFESSSELPFESSISYGGRIGYQLNPYFSFELEHQEYGEGERTDFDSSGNSYINKVSSSSTGFGIKGSYPLTQSASVFIRTGYAMWDFQRSVTNQLQDQTPGVFEFDGEDLFYGFGAEYSFTPMISVGVEYSIIDMTSSTPYSHEGLFEGDKTSSYGTETNTNEVENISLLLKIRF